MNEEIVSLKSQTHDKLVKKFGIEIDFDEMEEAVLTQMVAEQTKKPDENNHQTQIELGKLKVKISRKMFNSSPSDSWKFHIFSLSSTEENGSQESRITYRQTKPNRKV